MRTVAEVKGIVSKMPFSGVRNAQLHSLGLSKSFRDRCLQNSGQF